MILLDACKNKGATVEEIVVKDSEYCDWLLGQGWVAQRFAELHAAIKSRGAGTDDTPEHNALAGRFLDEQFLEAFIELRFSGWLQSWRPEALRHFLDTGKTAMLRSDVRFEIRGVDVIVSAYFSDGERILEDKKGTQACAEAWVEIKPSVGDDFPSIMRQMERLGCKTLLAGCYTGRGLEEEQVAEMFRASGLLYMRLQDVEASMTPPICPVMVQMDHYDSL